MSNNFCKTDGHDYYYKEYSDGHEFLGCTLCGIVFVDTRNRMSSEEKRDWIVAFVAAPFILGVVWVFIVTMWAAFG